ncbi:MAG: hypothetical protein ACQBVK_03095 [Candidatus Phytoplasma sp. TWB_XP]
MKKISLLTTLKIIITLLILSFASYTFYDCDSELFSHSKSISFAEVKQIMKNRNCKQLKLITGSKLLSQYEKYHFLELTDQQDQTFFNRIR